jgi:hypothetical protein
VNEQELHVIEHDLIVDMGWILVMEIEAYLWKVAAFEAAYPEN